MGELHGSPAWNSVLATRKFMNNNSPKQFSTMVEHIPLQHGSPVRRHYVFPTQPMPIHAFQTHNNNPKTVTLQEMKSKSRGSPLSFRRAKIQDSTFSTSSSDDETVLKIKAMFPTVSDTHIKMLLKKYHGREVVVISALQVEKYPISTPGPFATPPPTRNIHPSIYAPLQMTPPLSFRTASRVGSPWPGSGTSSTYTGSPRTDCFRNSPRPHSSPKLKLRYMKSIFPEAEEMLILDVLTGNENNIQVSSEVLRDMGFAKKDTVKIAQRQAEIKAEEEKLKEEESNKPPPSPPKLKTTAEKESIKKTLQEKYKDIAEHLIAMALESVNYNENRANQILQIMVDEEQQKTETLEIVQTVQEEEQQEADSPEIEHKETSDEVTSSVLPKEPHYKSSYQLSVSGANPENAKGANDKLLLEEYVNWQGPDLQLRQGPKQGLAKGANAGARIVRTYQARGPDASLRKGPNLGLAKGSIFSQLKGVVGGESRGN